MFRVNTKPHPLAHGASFYTNFHTKIEYIIESNDLLDLSQIKRLTLLTSDWQLKCIEYSSNKLNIIQLETSDNSLVFLD